MDKKGIALFTFLLVYSTLFGQSVNYKVGDTLFVWTENLILYRFPDQNSESLMNLEYGQKIIVKGIDNSISQYEIIRSINHKNKSTPGFTVTGQFFKTIYNGIEGYVYSGLLSKLIPINEGESLDIYFNRVFKRLKVIND